VTHDAGWSATVSGKEKQRIMLNGMAKAFYVEETGDYEIIIECKPQTIFKYSSLISLASLSAFLAHFVVGKSSIMTELEIY